MEVTPQEQAVIELKRLDRNDDLRREAYKNFERLARWAEANASQDRWRKLAPKL
jgi:hypothetical protein